jgi:redox-sensing transcriptional repressor
MLVASGVKGILNYAPIAPKVPPHVRIEDIDPVLSLQSMTYYVENLETPAKYGDASRRWRPATPLPSAGCA